MDREIANAEAHLRSVRGNIQDATAELTAIFLKKEDTHKEVRSLEERLSDLLVAVSWAEQRRDDLREEYEHLDRKYKLWSDELVKFTEQRETVAEDIRNLGKVRHEIEFQIADLLFKKNAVEMSLGLLGKNAEDSVEAVAQLESKRERIVRDIAALQEQAIATELAHTRLLESNRKELDEVAARIAAEQEKIGSADRSMAEREQFVAKQMEAVTRVQIRINNLYEKFFPGVTPPRL